MLVDVANEVPSWVMMRGVVYPGHEKAPFVRSGCAVRGALAYRPADDKLMCHECGRWFTGLGQHVRMTHRITAREYKQRHGLLGRTGLVTAKASRRLSERLPFALKQQQSPAKSESVRRFRRERMIANVALAHGAGHATSGPGYERRNESGTCHAQLLAKIGAVAQNNGGLLSRSILQSGGVHVDSILRAFNVSDVRELADRAALAFEEPAERESYSDEYLIESLRDFYVVRKTLPPYACFGHGSLPSYGTFVRRFGTISAAYKAAGLAIVLAEIKPRGWPLRVSNDQLAKRLQGFYSDHDRLPFREEYGLHGLPERKVLASRFNDMRSAWAYAGLGEQYDAMLVERLPRSHPLLNGKRIA